MGVSLPSDFADDYLLGMLAVRKGLITEAQLEEAVAIRQRSHPTPRLIEVIMEIGSVRQDDLNNIIKLYDSLLLGSTAIRLGLISQFQLDEAIGIQSRSEPRPLLGKVLTSLGYLSKFSLRRVIYAQEQALSEALLEVQTSKSQKQLTKRLRTRRKAQIKCNLSGANEKYKFELKVSIMAAGLLLIIAAIWMFTDTSNPRASASSESHAIQNESALPSQSKPPTDNAMSSLHLPLQTPRHASYPTDLPPITIQKNEQLENPSSFVKSRFIDEQRTELKTILASDLNNERKGTDASFLPTKQSSDFQPNAAPNPKAVVFKPEYQDESWDELNRPDLFVTSLTTDIHGCVWVGTEDSGVLRYNPRPIRGVSRWQQFIAKDGLCDDSVYALSCDKFGRVWAGTLRNGVSIYNCASWTNYNVPFGPIGERIFDIACNQLTGDSWIATSAGLSQYDASKDQWIHYTAIDGPQFEGINNIVLTKYGGLIIGTQCKGVYIAQSDQSPSAANSVYSCIKNNVLSFNGKGLSSNYINDIIVSKTNVIYVATCEGLSYSMDNGHNWNYIRGHDHENKYSYLTSIPVATDSKLFFPEDYIECLAEDANGRIWIGHRKYGISIFDLRAGTISNFKLPPTYDYIKSIMFVNNHVVVGCYGSGVISIKITGELRSNKVTFNKTDVSMPSRKCSNVMNDSKFVNSMKLINDSSMASCLLMADDWMTRGDWVGRYGNFWSDICAIKSPYSYISSLINKSVSCREIIGPVNNQKDAIRYWIHWLYTNNDRTLELPPEFYNKYASTFHPVSHRRRQAEIDDHGEAYPMYFSGPNLYIMLDVPKGDWILSLYLYNKDGHSGNNRYRDYIVKIKQAKLKASEEGDINSVDMAAYNAIESLVVTRVKDFWGGVYIIFSLKGGYSYTIEINRNYSFNTILSAIFLDMADISQPPYIIDNKDWASIVESDYGIMKRRGLSGLDYNTWIKYINLDNDRRYFYVKDYVINTAKYYKRFAFMGENKLADFLVELENSRYRNWKLWSLGLRKGCVCILNELENASSAPPFISESIGRCYFRINNYLEYERNVENNGKRTARSIVLSKYSKVN